MIDKGWHRSFDDPIPLPDGGKLDILRDAATYITGLPKREHDAPGLGHSAAVHHPFIQNALPPRPAAQPAQ
jgi:hypothetical protein